MALVGDALAQRATALAGAEPASGPGYFYRPTVLINVPRGAQLSNTEIFGPVTAFGTEDEAVALANDTSYGLVAYAFTGDLERALRVCDRLQAGMVGLNQGTVSNPAAPFGVKQSGLGREGGVEGVAQFLESKYVAIRS